MVALWVALGAVVVWILLHAKTSRPDGVLVRGLHPYRRMLAFLSVTRNESVVYFDAYVEAGRLLDYIARARAPSEVDITHCVVAACATALRENPRMNQFVAGRRLYARHGRFITFSMKRKRMMKEAKVSAVKIEARDGESFGELCARMNAQIGVERSDAETYTDKELGLLGRLPRPLLGFVVWLARRLDYYNLLPGGFLRGDPMYTSVFVANLGSLGMGAAYHHLYEWGNCPIFVVVGEVEERPVVADGAVVPRKTLHLRFAYDERIDDGLTARDGIRSMVRVLEDPFRELGGVA
jgi:hypothetical protein